MPLAFEDIPFPFVEIGAFIGVGMLLNCFFLLMEAFFFFFFFFFFFSLPIRMDLLAFDLLACFVMRNRRSVSASLPTFQRDVV